MATNNDKGDADVATDSLHEDLRAQDLDPPLSSAGPIQVCP